MAKEHEQFNLNAIPKVDSGVQGDFLSSGNVARTDKTLVVKDFFIANDIEVQMLKGQKFNRTAFSTLLSGSLYSVATTDYLIGVTSLSYAPSIGLPKPSQVGVGKTFIVKDEAGGSATTTITVRSAGEENIDGTSTSTLTTNYQSKRFYSDGSNWFTY